MSENQKGESMQQEVERIGRFKVRRFGGYVEKSVVFREGDRYFIGRALGRYPRQTVRRVDPPEDYPGRRSEGLIEFEVVS